MSFNPRASGPDTVHPDLAAYALSEGCENEYVVWMFMRHLSPGDCGMDAGMIVHLSKAIGWRGKSTIYQTLRHGNGQWWSQGRDGKHRRHASGINALFRMRHDPLVALHW